MPAFARAGPGKLHPNRWRRPEDKTDEVFHTTLAGRLCRAAKMADSELLTEPKQASPCPAKPVRDQFQATPRAAETSSRQSLPRNGQCRAGVSASTMRRCDPQENEPGRSHWKPAISAVRCR